MLEMAIVMAIVFIVSAIAIIELQPTWQQMEANAAMDQVKTVLRQARELSISQRRTIAVQFVGNNQVELFQYQIQYTPLGAPTQVISTTPFLTVPIENHVAFMTFATETDTPDQFSGTISPPGGIYFGGVAGGPPAGMEFQSDGTFTDGNGNPINGTVFLGVANLPPTARAVTVLGNTGRIKSWRATSAWGPGGAGWSL
jgi:type II secretory pathway pseudopilin PulG